MSMEHTTHILAYNEGGQEGKIFILLVKSSFVQNNKVLVIHT